jgi:3',5'-nucleoside bisphosphate phosphatase
MNELGRIDLHTHSTCSDGSLAPPDLVRRAAEVGLAGLSITDHDTLKAYALAKPTADQLGLVLIPGAELSTTTPFELVHVLAYSYRLNDPALVELCLRHVKRRQERNLAILNHLKRAGMVLEERDLLALGEGTVGRPHIAQLLLDRGYVTSIQEAFNRFLGEGKSCYAAGDRITVEETIESIHAAGGYAVIAHPHLLKNSQTVAYLLRLPFDGIEGYYARMAKNVERKWIDLARGHKWMVTGGSDFHGDSKPVNAIGSSWAPPETVPLLLERARANGILV